MSGSGSSTKNLWQLINTLTGRVKAHCTPRADLEDLSETFSAVVTDLSRPARLIPPAADHSPLDDGQPYLEAFSSVTMETVHKQLVAIYEKRATGSVVQHTTSVAEAVHIDPHTFPYRDY